MTQTLDQALQAVTAAEATLTADKASAQNIQTAIDTATAPLAAAEEKVKTDVTDFNACIDTAVNVLTASKIAV